MGVGLSALERAEHVSEHSAVMPTGLNAVQKLVPRVFETYPLFLLWAFQGSLK